MNGHVLPVFKDSPIREISYRDVVEFRSGLKVGSKRANNIISLIKSVFDFADKEGFIKDNIVRKIKRLKEEEPEIHPFTYLEIDLILNAIDPWYRPYTCVGFFTGMRAGDINGLRWTDYLEDMKPDPKIFVRKA